MAYDALYLSFLVYFNRDRDYFECHEVMEELWLSKGSDPLYKGLLQVAVGLFHFRANNVRGSRMMMESALKRLAPYSDDSLGIDLGRLKQEVEDFLLQLDHYGVKPFEFYDLTIHIVDPALEEATQIAAQNLQPNEPIQLKRMRGPKHDLRGTDRT